MKKTEKRILAITLMLICVISSLLTLFVPKTNIIKAQSMSEYVHTNQNENKIIFPTYEDYLKSNRRNAQPFNSYGESWLPIETISTKNLNEHFLGYHAGTSYWAKASSYTIDAGQNYRVKGNYKWQNVTLNLGFIYPFPEKTTISANSSRYSKLGIYAYYTLKSVRYAQYLYGQPTGYTRVSTFATRTSNYIYPTYQ